MQKTVESLLFFGVMGMSSLLLGNILASLGWLGEIMPPFSYIMGLIIIPIGILSVYLWCKQPPY